MIINMDTRENAYFHEINTGDCYYLPGAQNNIFMRTEDVIVNDDYLCEEDILNAVHLITGHMVHVDDNELIVPVTLEARIID